MNVNADAIIHTLRKLCVRDKHAIYRALRADGGVMAFDAERHSRRIRTTETYARRPTRKPRLRALTAEEFLKL